MYKIYIGEWTQRKSASKGMKNVLKRIHPVQVRVDSGTWETQQGLSVMELWRGVVHQALQEIRLGELRGTKRCKKEAEEARQWIGDREGTFGLICRLGGISAEKVRESVGV